MNRLAMVVLCVLSVCVVTGCANSTGWRVTFGVAPVKSLQDMQGLKQVDDRKRVED